MKSLSLLWWGQSIVWNLFWLFLVIGAFMKQSTLLLATLWGEICVWYIILIPYSLFFFKFFDLYLLIQLFDIYYACSFVYVSGKSVFLIIYCSSMFKKMFAFFLLLIVVSAAFFRENCHFYTEKWIHLFPFLICWISTCCILPFFLVENRFVSLRDSIDFSTRFWCFFVESFFLCF